MPSASHSVFSVGQRVRTRRVVGHRVERSGRSDQAMGHSVRRCVVAVVEVQLGTVVAVNPASTFDAVTVVMG